MKGNTSRFLGIIFVLSLFLTTPAFVRADANAQCAMWNPACPCGMGIVMDPLTGQCPGTGNTAGCPVGICQEQTPKGPVQGICATAGKCKGVLTAEGKGVGLGQVSQIMQGMMQGLQSMMQGGGGGGGGGQQGGQQGGMGSGLGSGLTGSTPWTGTTCTGAQYTVSYPSTDPCAIYQPPVSSSLNGGASLLESFTGGSLNLLNAANSTTQQTLQTQQPGGASGLLQDTVGNGQTQGSQSQQNTSSQQGSSGQGSSLAQPSGGTSSSGGSNEVIETTIPGAQNTRSGDVGAMSPDMTLEGGARGDITAGDSGATVYVGARDAENNRETAGFYGSSGGTGTSIVSRWCTSRPWATNFLSKIVSPGFFDGLCSWRGYQVGAAPASNVPSNGIAQPVTVLQQRRVSTTTAPAPTTTVVVPAGRVQIWAVPAKVSLGSRTSVFWATENVTNCIETSPDGSFYQSSLSGGASTVPLTGPTTFSISCQDGAGNPVTGSVTVTIKN